MAGKILVFRHSPGESLGRISDSLEPRGIAPRYADLYLGGAPPDIRDADGLIVMGGPMSANDDCPFIRQELDIISEALALGKPILGVCLGAQLVAKALGARVYNSPVKEIGWYPVYWTEAGAREFSLNGPETMFQWHGETFDLPPGAELLAYSDGCRHQAFRVGSTYGLQFHLEVTPAMIADWLTDDAACGDRREITTSVDPQENSLRLKVLAAKVFGRWCDIVRGSQPAGTNTRYPTQTI
jgi:GMP synthase-like glutamine amidotransferase